MAALRADVGGGCGGCSGDGGHGGGRAAAEGGGERHFSSILFLPSLVEGEGRRKRGIGLGWLGSKWLMFCLSRTEKFRGSP